MYSLIYFDVEDFFSSPDSPVHKLPGQMADILSQYGIQGCFHIHGEKARFMEQHRQYEVINALKRHDVSLHFNRGSIHPTTAEEVSQLDWFQGVDRVFYREIPGFQSLEKIWGKCSSLTQHGGTFASQIVYAAGRLGKPFFYSPFRLPGRNIVWFCNNLLIGGYQADFSFDRTYRNDNVFATTLDKLDGYLNTRQKQYDFTALFGCHPVITIMEKFPDAINFSHGNNPSSLEWIPPTLVKGASIPLVLANFAKLIKKLTSTKNIHWTTVAGIEKLYGKKPDKIKDCHILEGAEEVIKNKGPVFTSFLSAAELLLLLAERYLQPKTDYIIPSVMGPIEDLKTPEKITHIKNIQDIASEIINKTSDCGYLPHAIANNITPQEVLIILAYAVLDKKIPDKMEFNLDIEAIPGVCEAVEIVKGYGAWSIHGPLYNQASIVKHFRLQCWTLKPAFCEHEYPADILLA